MPNSLFDRIRIPEAMLPGAIESIAIDCLFSHILIQPMGWTIKYTLYQAGTDIGMLSGDAFLDPSSSQALSGLKGLEAAIQSAATALMPLMLQKLNEKLVSEQAE